MTNDANAVEVAVAAVVLPAVGDAAAHPPPSGR
jgi:hypothetical protein